MKKCSKCGYEGESKFCPECGGEMEEIIEVAEEATAVSAPEKKSTDKKTIIIVVLAIVIIALAGYIVLNMGGSSLSIGGDVTLAENQGKPLPGGTYIVGEDIPAGKYMLMYTTTMTEDDYWSSDYLWITYAGSEGSDETLGGTKFDDRFGDVEYESAVEGESFYTTFNDGDTIRVDSEYGDWTY